MGNELSAVGGAVATVGTSVAAGVTFGQVDDLNNAVEDCAIFTAKNAADTSIRHIGETVGHGVATAGMSVASGVTFGQIDDLNNEIKKSAKRTAKSGETSGIKLGEMANDTANGIPIVGHIKGGIHYACDDKEGGDTAMKSSSRTVGIVGGAVGGFACGGPAGAVIGGVAGGVAMDGAITGWDSAINNEYRPYGSVDAWGQVLNANNGEDRAGAIISGITGHAMDGVAGYTSGASSMAKPKPSGLRTRVNHGGARSKPQPKRNNIGNKPKTVRKGITKETHGENRRRPTDYIKPDKSQNMKGNRNNFGNKPKTVRKGITKKKHGENKAGTMRRRYNTEQDLGGYRFGPTPRNMNSALNDFMETQPSSRNYGSRSNHSFHAAESMMTAMSENSLYAGRILYRGVPKGIDPLHGKGGGGSQLGKGSYWTDRPDIAKAYATDKYHNPGDVYEYHYRRSNHPGKQYYTEKEGGGVKQDFRRENRSFDEFVVVKTAYCSGNQYRFCPKSARNLDGRIRRTDI